MFLDLKRLLSNESLHLNLFQVYGVISVISGMANIWSLMAITVERAWVIFCITRGKQHRVNMTRMLVVVATIWIAALATSIPPLLGWNRYVYEVMISSIEQTTNCPFQYFSIVA